MWNTGSLSMCKQRISKSDTFLNFADIFGKLKSLDLWWNGFRYYICNSSAILVFLWYMLKKIKRFSFRWKKPGNCMVQTLMPYTALTEILIDLWCTNGLLINANYVLKIGIPTLVNWFRTLFPGFMITSLFQPTWCGYLGSSVSK